MQELVNQCLNLIIKDKVDEVVQAFRDSYFWCVKKESTIQLSYDDMLKQFLDGISNTLKQNKYKRVIISNEEMAKLSFRHSSKIVDVIQGFLNKLEKKDRITFLSELNGAYALSVPELLFRTAKTYLGLHKTPDFPAIDDNLPMTDDMILFAWQYDWFYSWPGY